MGNGLFLFKFASGITVKQVVVGDWTWKNTLVNLQWWNPLLGIVEEKDKADITGARIVGLSPHLWSKKIF